MVIARERLHAPLRLLLLARGECPRRRRLLHLGLGAPHPCHLARLAHLGTQRRLECLVRVRARVRVRVRVRGLGG